jgi:hypothetical protein
MALSERQKNPADIEKNHGAEIDAAVEHLIEPSGPAFMSDTFVSSREINDALALKTENAEWELKSIRDESMEKRVYAQQATN